MFGFEGTKKKLRTWARKEIARETRTTMMSHQAARQTIDIFEMRLEAIETRLCKRVLHLEDRVAELEAALSLIGDRDAPTERPAERKAG
ncbi:MAG: hypothetical protein AAFU55_03305 [Pseudomonadota bacterium]